MNQLEQRVTHLEKSLKYYRIFFAAIISTILIIALMSAGKNNVPEVIQAKSFEVVDDNGKKIAELCKEKEKGNGRLATYSASTGKMLVDLFTTNGGTGGINTFDSDGDVIFKVTNTSGGGGYMALFNASLKEVAEFGVTTSQGGYINTNDKYGDKIVRMTNTENGGGYLALLNNNLEVIRFSTPYVGGRIGVSNKNNKRVIYIGTQENQEGNITIYDDKEKIIGSLPK